MIVKILILEKGIGIERLTKHQKVPIGHDQKSIEKSKGSKKYGNKLKVQKYVNKLKVQKVWKQV